ncbi:YitT family protein [Helcococcus ovis]|uniref:YitT family protein n=1 Tax=Helcococcus ovis TaxID=72026 RepID=UPI001430A494|nr:YitT family protein [Helcococcus ovis]WNZ00865.1 YitT family protein [Helcococcus ovis]
MKKISLRPKLGQEHKPMSKTKEFVLLNIGVILTAIGVYYFKFPNHFAIGGVSGISVILHAVFPNMNAATFNLIFNMILLLIGIFFFGKNFGIKTAYATIVISLLVQFFSICYPITKPFTNQPLLELIYAVLLPGVGGGLLFNCKASSGGTDIVAMILKKYTSLDIGRALLVSDILITALSFKIFGALTGLLAMLGLIAKAFLIDITIENINRVKLFSIVTEYPDEIIEFIKNDLHRGGTRFNGVGIYMNKEKTMINVAVSNYEGVLLRDFARKHDPNCFITILNTSQIVGKGFHFVS